MPLELPLEELVSRLAIALGIGLLVGLERGWRQRDAKAGSRTAGIRTFAITGILGGCCGALARALGDGIAGAIVLSASLAIYAAAFATFARMEGEAKANFSVTTTVAAIATFVLSAYAMLGDIRFAVAAAVAMTGLLALREWLHGWVEDMAWRELRSVLVLLAMTFIALPLMPDRPISPAIDVNPREVWLIAIALAAVSFGGYVAVKYFGSRYGILLSAAAGGLVSSTAVTLAHARRAAESKSSRLLAAGVAVATAISFLRVIAIAGVLRPQLLWIVGPPIAAAMAMAAGFALFAAMRSSRGAEAKVDFRNPFQFWSVLGFALLLGGYAVVARYVGEWFGAVGTFASAAVLGLADVDAVAVSLSRIGVLSARDAGLGILAAVATNTLSKLVIGAGLGGGAFARRIALLAAACYAAAGIVFWFTPAGAPS